jgi:hypothetical protein
LAKALADCQLVGGRALVDERRDRGGDVLIGRLKEVGRDEAVGQREPLGDGDGKDMPFRIEGGRWGLFHGLEVRGD